MQAENMPTGETMSEGSDMPPSEEMSNTPETETSVEKETSPITEEKVADETLSDENVSTTQMYFDSLDDSEKQELMDLCMEWSASKGKSTMPGSLKPAPKGNIDFKSIEKEMAGTILED